MNKQTQKGLLDIVEKNYNNIAREFNETRKKELWQELLNITKSIKDNDKILDVGCGNGRIIDALIEKKIKYQGVDQSTELINLAKKNYSNIPNAKFSVGKIQNLNTIKEVNFNWVFAVAVLHHLPGVNLQVDALKQLKNKVKRDGRIVVSVWRLWNKEKYRKMIIKFSLLKIIGKNKMDWGDITFDWIGKKNDLPSKRYYHAFTKRGLKKVADKAGLKVEKIYKDRYNYYLILKWK